MLIRICNIQRAKEKAVSKGYTKEVILAKSLKKESKEKQMKEDNSRKRRHG